MDGGGRVAEPLTAGRTGGRAEFALPRLAVLGFGRRRRRRSVAVPIGRRLPRFTGTALTFGFFAAVAATGLVQNGSYADLRAAYGDPRDLAARAVGLGVEKVTIAGIAGLSEIDVLTTGGITPTSSLPFIGAAELRDRLQSAPLVESADVRKLYPNELAITLVERVPFALWQKDGEIFLVSADGTVIDRLRDRRFTDLPLVVGDEANVQAGDYAALLAASGALRPKIRAGMLVSGRRWTLKMENGIDVRLPEEGAAAAVGRLSRLDREGGLLDKDVLAIDLRMPDRIVVRLTEEAVAARTEANKKKPGRGVKGADT